MVSIIVIAAVFAAVYLLYNFGFIAVQQKRALLFTASMNGLRAKFSGCTGKITRIVRFKKSGNHTLRFQKSAEKGAIAVSLFDPHGNALISEGEEEIYSIPAEAGKRYKLRILLVKATGSYSIEIE